MCFWQYKALPKFSSTNPAICPTHYLVLRILQIQSFPIAIHIRVLPRSEMAILPSSGKPMRLMSHEHEMLWNLLRVMTHRMFLLFVLLEIVHELLRPERRPS